MDAVTAAPDAARPSTAPTSTTSATSLRRISRGSLTALSASRSRFGPGQAYEGLSSISHLAPVFAELSEAMEDLSNNFAALDEVSDYLADFNEGFASFMYGLRMNAYTCAFPGVSSLAPACWLSGKNKAC